MLRKWLEKLVPIDSFRRNALTLITGTGIAQGLNIAVSPVLTRLYNPQDFGILAIYSVILGVVTVIASLRYELAISLPKDSETAANLLVSSVIICVGTSLLVGLGIWTLSDQIVSWTNAPLLKPYLWLIPLGTLSAGLGNAFNYWAIRKRAFFSIARNKLNRSLGQVLTQVGLGSVGIGPIGLLLGQVVGQIAGASTLAKLTLMQDRSLVRSISLSNIKRVIFRYKKFPTLSTAAAILNNLGLQLPLLMLSIFWDSTSAGFFVLTQRVLNIPLNLIATAVGELFFSEGTNMARQNASLYPLFRKVTKTLFFLIIGPAIILAFIAPDLFAIVFGEDWREAGLYTRFLVPVLVAQFVVAPVARIFIVVERLDFQLIWDASRLLLVAFLFYLFKNRESPIASITAYSTGLTLLYIGLYFVFARVAQQGGNISDKKNSTNKWLVRR